MRHPLPLAASLAVLLGSGCPGPQQPSSFPIPIQLHAGASTQLPAPVRLAMVWYPTWLNGGEGRPPVVGSVMGVTVEGAIPNLLAFTLHDPPPDAAMVDLAAAGGQGKEAYGLVVAFEDRNGNGTLDLGTAATPSPDRILGISGEDPSLPPPLHHAFVAYLDGTQGQDDYLWAFKMEQGYTLFQSHSDYGTRIAPAGTAAEVELTNTDALQLYGCAEADFTWGYRTACGIDPYAGDYRIRGALYEYRPATLYVEDGHGQRSDATILLNGTPLPYDAQSGSYGGDRPPVGANTLQIDVPGHPRETIQVTVPAPVQLTTAIPAAVPAGTRLTVGWSDDPAIELYDILVYGEDNRYLFHENFNENAFTTDPIMGAGVVQVRVLGLGPLAFGAQGHWVRPVSRAAGSFTVQ